MAWGHLPNPLNPHRFARSDERVNPTWKSKAQGRAGQYLLRMAARDH
jgi:hypothetical protein